MKTLQIKIVALAVLAVLALPTAALGASSDEGYGGPNNVVSGVQTNNDEGPPPSPEPESETAGVETVSASDDSDDVLPFTGTDLLIMAASGGLLLMFGFGLRRLTRRQIQP
jgi:hypothetical protein